MDAFLGWPVTAPPTPIGPQQVRLDAVAWARALVPYRQASRARGARELAVASIGFVSLAYALGPPSDSHVADPCALRHGPGFSSPDRRLVSPPERTGRAPDPRQRPTHLQYRRYRTAALPPYALGRRHRGLRH